MLTPVEISCIQRYQQSHQRHHPLLLQLRRIITRQLLRQELRVMREFLSRDATGSRHGLLQCDFHL
jgi:hypothetical protein